MMEIFFCTAEGRLRIVLQIDSIPFHYQLPTHDKSVAPDAHQSTVQVHPPAQASTAEAPEVRPSGP